MHNPFRYVNSSPEVMRLVVMMYIRYPLSLREVDDMLVERGIDICHDTVRLWWNRFGPLFAAQIRKQRVPHRPYAQWRGHFPDGLYRDDVFATKRRGCRAALKFLKVCNEARRAMGLGYSDTHNPS